MTKTTGFRRGPQMMRLADRHEIATGIYSVRLIPHEPVPHVVPGTFLDLLLGGGHVLRRPLSIADADDEGYTLVFRVVGKGTDTLSVKPIGAEVDVLGPLGHGFDVDAVQPEGRALLIGGGVGIPPLYLLGRRLVERGVEVQFRLGFRDRNDIFWAERFGQLGEVLVSTDDGSVGTKGTVAQIAETDEARRFVPDLVQACGPLPMLRWVKSALAPTVRTQLSLEERMACGVGACYESKKSQRPSVLVLGSGPIRIGQGIEFDYATVHSVKAIQAAGYEAIIMNSNPETVSTDFSISDKLYFEPLTFEDVMNVIDLEQPDGVIVQFGGQTAINLAGPLSAAGVPILGTQVADLDRAEDREGFESLLAELGIPQAPGGTARSSEEAFAVAEELGYRYWCAPHTSSVGVLWPSSRVLRNLSGTCAMLCMPALTSRCWWIATSMVWSVRSTRSVTALTS